MIYLYERRAEIYSRLRKYDEALADYDQSIKIFPGDSSSYFGKGRIYQELKKPVEAEENYLKAIELKPTNADYYFRLMHFYREYNKDEELIEIGKKLKQLPSLLIK